MDPISTAALAGATLAATAALQSVGEEAGRSSWTVASRLVERIRHRFAGNHEAEGALARACDSPDDEAAVGELHRVLHEYMLRDSEFAQEVRRLVDESVRSAGGVGGINAAVIKNVQVNHGKVEVAGDLNFS
ncbi:hypothetical protein [Kitasatospora cathayae]|uniref:RHIM domain-containing protein n=1 Tax=Kitasatospora cathayae TaxID=3004092 RepID=A0ABY7Q996_9ACTN|nr:hypothetical protein [Kitasatospora sp. HUAS 3-15]WBP89270.1 hypothetical protein O1G21_27790 [Kitasatospora sp. HUAS 3-15]